MDVGLAPERERLFRRGWRVTGSTSVGIGRTWMYADIKVVVDGAYYANYWHGRVRAGFERVFAWGVLRV